MFKKFLIFLGLTSVQLEDGKAKFEMTEEQIEASGKLIEEKETAVAKVAELEKSLKEEKEQKVTAQSELAKANEKNIELEKEIAELRKAPGASSLVASKETDGNADADPNVVRMPEGVSIVEKLAAFTKELDEYKS